MRILNVGQTYFPYLAGGGLPVKVRILSRKLAQRGHSVTVHAVNVGSAEWLVLGATPEKTSAGWRAVEDPAPAGEQVRTSFLCASRPSLNSCNS